MDIEELKNFAKNKIEADDITKKVRQRIKETIWEKQNQREGFSETFKPLISQFEKPEDPKTKNIFTQNQEMLRNQLALTEGLRDNQKAITQGFSQFERLADMQELPGVEANEEAQAPIAKEAQAPIAEFSVEDLNKHLNDEEQDTLKSIGYKNLPSYYFDKDISEISELIKDVEKNLNFLNSSLKNTALIEKNKGYNLAKAINQKPHSETKNNIKRYNALSIYSSNLNKLLDFKGKLGSGIFYINPQELLKRFELLNGSLAAGNNGVLPEYIQIAHRLRDLGIITNNQLSTLLRKVI